MLHAGSTEDEIRRELARCDDVLTDLSNPSHYSRSLTDYDWSREWGRWTDRRKEAQRLAEAKGITGAAPSEGTKAA